MIPSTKIKYGMLALTYLAKKTDHEVVSSKQISDELCIPKEMVSKILQSLVYKGFLGSKKGKNGGFYLSVDPSKTNVHAVLTALGYTRGIQSCFLGLNGLCEDNYLCNLCNGWEKINDEFENVTMNMSIRKLSESRFVQNSD